jgi:hypothetical protein
MTACVPSEIRTGSLPNTSRKRHHSSRLTPAHQKRLFGLNEVRERYNSVCLYSTRIVLNSILYEVDL